MASGPSTFMDSVERFLLRTILIAVALLALLLGFAYWHVRHQPGAGLAPAASPAASTSLTLTIDYGDGTQKRFTDLPFTPGMTVLDAMVAARSHTRPLAFTTTGSGDTTLVSEIDGLANQGVGGGAGGGSPRNWQFWVNDRYGEASIGAVKLGAGDRVTWAFRPYEQGPAAPR